MWEAINVHEFMSLDGVIDAPTWTADYGSGTLVRAMLADSLVDELHLFVYPLTRGSGPRPFFETATPGSFSPAACESYENGVLYLAYGPADVGPLTPVSLRLAATGRSAAGTDLPSPPARASASPQPRRCRRPRRPR